MKKQLLVNGITYLACMVAAALLNLAVSALVVKIVNVLIAPDFFVIAIVRAVTGIFTVCVVLGLVIGYEGYTTLSFSIPKILLPVLGASIIHFGFSFLLKFYPFIAGGTQYLGGILEYGSSFNSFESVSDVSLWAYIVAFWVSKIAELIVAPLSCFIGMRKRINNRKTIEGYPND